MTQTQFVVCSCGRAAARPQTGLCFQCEQRRPAAAALPVALTVAVYAAPPAEDRQVIAAFVIAGEPVSKARARFTNYRSKNRTYTPEKTRTAEDAVERAFRQVAGGVGPHKGWAYEVEADFYAGTRQRRDVDNMLKLILDGLNGVAWVDDTQVIRVSAAKHLVDPGQARTEIIVYRNGDVPTPRR